MRRASEPAPRDTLVGAWLICVCISVLAMVLVGGATRLTDSGLSITEWNLAKGLMPPLSAERWAEEFALYQRTTEYQLQNQGMSLGQFQSIYWWEWAHRFLGKMLGVVFVVPFIAFFLMGRLKERFGPISVLFYLGGLQGAVGWWMVTSGLFSGLDVSPVRLATHLGLAFVILAYALWLALDAFGWPRAASTLGAPRWAPWALMGLIFAQVIFGALLAGANGGPAYADWPTIGRQWFPTSALALDPIWRNLTENHAAQHLLHRSTGYAVALLTLALAAAGAARGQGPARQAALVVGVLALVQAGLGVATVLMAVPLHLALAHQLGAVALWMGAVIIARLAGSNIPS
jgi:cytochrome c oxidase assembly protein subunit 15